MLHLHPLSYRRENADLLYVFKCIERYYDLSLYNDIEELSNSSLRYGNAGLEACKLLEQGVLK